MQRVSEKHKLILHGQIEPKVIGDPDRIRQVLINLITNAIKYSPQADRVDISSTIDGGSVIISVKDFGIGIPKSEQQKIFDRFYQASDTTGNTFPGLGLGLYISSEIIKRHNGKLWVESTPGKGSTFSFSLPIASNNNRKLHNKRKNY
jgi:signal transduction histidine kinase